MDLTKTLLRIIPAALVLLNDGDEEVRKGAAISFGKLRCPLAAEVVFERFHCDRIDESLAFILAKVDSENASRLLVAALNDPNVSTRIAAAEALSELHSETSVKVLIDALENYLSGKKKDTIPDLVSEEALICAIQALGRIGDKQGLALLQELLLKERNAKLRATAISSLAINFKSCGQAVFQRFLKDPDPRVRANAIDALGKFDNKALIGILQPCLYDQVPRIRANAAKVIWKYGDYDVTSALKEMLFSNDKKMRVSGIYVVGELRLETFKRQVLKSLKDEDPDVRRNAAIAARKFCTVDAVPCLQEVVDDPVPEVRLHVLQALAEILKNDAVETILCRCEVEPEPHIRSAAIALVGKWGTPGILMRLVHFFSDPDYRVVANAIEAVFQIQPSTPSLDLIPPIRKFLTSENSRAKGNAIRGLWNWGFHEVLGNLYELLTSNDSLKKRTGLFCLGEIFAAVSIKGGESLDIFVKIFSQCVSEYRQKTGKSSIAGSVDPHIKQIWEKFEESIKLNKINEAKNFLEEIIKIDQKYQPALLSLGELYFREGNLQRAEEVLLKAIEINDQLVKGHFILGQIYYQTNKWDKATHHLLKVINIYPKMPQPYLLLGEALEKQEKFNEANEVLKRLQALVPKSPEVLALRSKICFFIGNISEALALAKITASLGKLDVRTQFILGFGEYLSNNFDTGLLYMFYSINEYIDKYSMKISSELKKLIAASRIIITQKTANKKANPSLK